MKKYLITSAQLYTDTPTTFKSNLSKAIENYHPEYILYRDKENLNYESLAVEFISLCKQFSSVKSFLHQDIQLASQLGAYGVHLTSLQFAEIQTAKEKSLKVVISTHTHEEVLRAQDLGADYVTYSPIFTSPNKGAPKGVEDLESLLKKCEIKVIALGGIISQEHIQELQKVKPYGFASIRYFMNPLV